jgi:syntaxin 5
MRFSIDHNVEEIDTNVQAGQQQLLKYMASVSSNRWLMAKIFLILISFMLVFVLFFA